MQSFAMQGHKREHHVNFLQPRHRGLQHFSLPEYSENSGKCISITLSTHVETVVLLSKGAEQRSGGPLLSADRSGTETGRQQKSEGGLLSGEYGFI